MLFDERRAASGTHVHSPMSSPGKLGEINLSRLLAVTDGENRAIKMDRRNGNSAFAVKRFTLSVTQIERDEHVLARIDLPGLERNDLPIPSQIGV